MTLQSAELDVQLNATCLMQYLDSMVWDQNPPRILRKQTGAILVCPTTDARLINVRIPPSSHFSRPCSFTYSIALSLSVGRETACVYM